MGKTFKYIAEEALPRHGLRETCESCGQDGLVFSIFIEETLAPFEPEALCARCIKTIPLRWIHAKNDERLATSLINQRYPKGSKTQDQRFSLTVELADEYRRTPWLPSFTQGIDWPRCCGDFAEFLGHAGESESSSPQGDLVYWGDDDDMAAEHGIEECMKSEDPVDLFRCLSCSKKLWSWQTT